MQEGTRVEGSYMGVEYTGTVFSSRPHTINFGIMNYIRLDTPIVIFDNLADPRDTIIVYERGPDAGSNTISIIR